MRWMPRVRIVLARRPWIRWVIVMTAAAVVALMVTSALADIRRARDAWGTTREVQVATRELAPGDALVGAVETRSLPVAMVPASAIVDLAPGATARQRIAVGETVLETDLAGRVGPLALLPDGWLAVTVRDLDDTAWLHAGDGATILAEGRVVAAEAIILTCSDTAALVGAPADDATAVADAVNRHVAVLALSTSRR